MRLGFWASKARFMRSPDLLLGTQTCLLPELEQGIAGIGPGWPLSQSLPASCRAGSVPRVVAGLIVLTEQIGGASAGRIEAQELGPLLALGKIGEIAALEPVGLGVSPCWRMKRVQL